MHEEISDYLYDLANPVIAEHLQVFFKTGKGEYAEGDIFLGIRVPIIRKAVGKFKTAPLNSALILLHSKYHEIRLFALLLLLSHFSKADPSQQEEIYTLYLDNTLYINHWDLVDTTAHCIVGVFLEHRSRAVLYQLALSESLWERRIAMVSCFHFIRQQDFSDALRIAEQLLNDQHDLIHKAVGWMLREIGNRDKLVETDFLKKHYKIMPRTMLRYAIEKFDKNERQHYLKGLI